MVIPVGIGALGTILKDLLRRLDVLKIGGRVNHTIVAVGQNTKKSPGAMLLSSSERLSVNARVETRKEYYECAKEVQDCVGKGILLKLCKR